MKIPYVKIYTADLLAKARKLSPEQIGRAVVGVCEQAFENQTAYKPINEEERSFYEMLLNWKNASVSVIKSRKKAGRKGGLATQSKSKLSDGSNASPFASSKNFSLLQADKQALLEKRQFSDGSTAILPVEPQKREKEEKEKVTQKEKEEREKKILTADCAAGLAHLTAEPTPIPNLKPKLNKLQEFSNAVLANFENPMNDTQKGIWFKRNCRCLADILNYCGKDIPLALQTVSVCTERLEKAGFTGGYEAVCRNLPEYYQQAKKRLEVNYANEKR